MLRRAELLAVALVVAVAVGGCGGGGGAPPPPGDNQVGSAQGRIDAQGGSPANFQLVLDGRPVTVPIGPDGSFEIPDIPVGDHVLDVIGPDGMRGARVEFRVRQRMRESLVAIRPELCGQIAGIVSKLENGVLTPLVGVRVVARSDLIWIATDGGEQSVRPAQASDPGVLVYPPPPGMTYRALTDENGSHLMRAVRPGSYFVTVAVPGLERGEAFVVVRPGQTAVADFRLEPAAEPRVGVVAGKVVGVDSAGGVTPIEGALVQVVMDNGWRPPPPPDPIPLPMGLDFPRMAGSSGPGEGSTIVPPEIIWQVFSTLTGKDGAYLLRAPAGACTVSVWAWRYGPGGERAVVRADATTIVDFKLRQLPRPESPSPQAPTL